MRDRSPLSTIALAARQATGKRRLTAIADRGYYSGMELTAYEETFPPANFDPSIDPSADQVRALRDAGPDGPVVMLNLLKFRERANYPAGSPHAPCDALVHRYAGLERTVLLQMQG